MRWYRLYCCKADASSSLYTVWGEHIVHACGIAAAFDAARGDGWYPVSVIKSGWSRSEI